MGLGDHMMAIGDAWAAHRADPARRPVALGNGRQLTKLPARLDHGLDFLATQADLDAGRPVNWLHNYPGARPYLDYAGMSEIALQQQLRRWHADHAPGRALLAPLLRPYWRRRKVNQLLRAMGHYVFSAAYRPAPARFVETEDERDAAVRVAAAGRFIVIEPSIKADAPPSKQWPVERYAEVARRLAPQIRVLQLGDAQSSELGRDVERLETATYREALAVLARASLYIGAEGGLHHGAAAVGIPAIVLFGGFASPLATGYDSHVNLTGGETRPCGTRFGLCPHCMAAMDRITVDQVVAEAQRLLT